MPDPVPGAAAPVVCLRGVSVVRDGRPILDNIDWDVSPGERWAALGPNGAGKTTLLHVAGMRLFLRSIFQRSRLQVRQGSVGRALR